MSDVTKDEKFIKKKYGEDMWKLCDENFSTIKEEEGLLSALLDKYFDHGRGLYSYLVENGLETEFQEFIDQKVNPPIEEDPTVIPDKEPEELLKEVGYTLHECKTNDDIKKFEKYYDKKERLCTFDADRLKTNYVYFAVKDNVDEIKREDFTDPKREDEYGTSVLSFQFSRGKGHVLSIKNRYNHSVKNPDATYGNDLDKIVPGLRASFAYYKDLKQTKTKEEIFIDHMKGYITDNYGKFHKIIVKEDDIYFCENNYIVERESHTLDKKYLDKERYLFMDGYILDLKEKKFINYFEKPFYKSFENANGKIRNIEVLGQSKNKKVIITPEYERFPITIYLSSNHIVYYENENVKELGNRFMKNCEELEGFYLPNVEKVNNQVFSRCRYLKNIYMPSCKEIGGSFAELGSDVVDVRLDSVEKIGDFFLQTAVGIHELNLPSLKEIGNSALKDNFYLEKFSAEKLETMGFSCFESNSDINELNLPKLKYMGNKCFNSNLSLDKILLPNLEIMGDRCFTENKIIEFADLDNIKEIGNDCISNNLELEELFMPNVKKIGNNFLKNNEVLDKLYANRLIEVGDNFLSSNNSLIELSLPSLMKFGKGFLNSNKVLKK